MGEIETYGKADSTLREMFALWRVEAKKRELEHRCLGRPQSHGNLFTALVREHLGVETEKKSQLKAERDGLSAELARLKALLRENWTNRESGCALP